MRRASVIVAMCALAVAGCARPTMMPSDSAQISRGRDAVGADALPSPLDRAPADEAQAYELAPPTRSVSLAPPPVPEPEPAPDDGVHQGWYRVDPQSGPAEPGVAYPYAMHTHCGIDGAVLDFDESLWDLVSPNDERSRIGSPYGFDDPIDAGTVTLAGENEARYVSAHGAEAVYARHAGPMDFPPTICR